MKAEDVITHPDELTDKQLEDVIGGMSPKRFSAWRSKMLNRRMEE